MMKEEVKNRLEKDKASYLLAQYVDIHGTPRCKGIPARAFDNFVNGSAGFAGAAVWGMGQGPHSNDMIAIPDLDTYTPLLWEDGVVRFACDIQVNGKEWPYCSRTILKRAINDLYREGYVMMVGIEAEHMLVTRKDDGTLRPFNPDGFDTMKKPCYDFKSLAANMKYLRTLIDYMERLGWGPYASDHEDGNGQYEVNWNFSDALTLADRYTFFKMMTSQVARRFGAIATHMPKPFAHLTGNGSHLHFSLWDPTEKTNLFRDDKDKRGLGMSKLAYHFLGGLISHAPALTCLVAPTVNCYKRLSVGELLTGGSSGFSWTPACISYGGNNRTQMFRAPESGRFECRTVSGAVNPYLGIAAFITAGLDGLRKKIDPGEPNTTNLYDLTLEEIAQRNLRFIPQSLDEALGEFEKDEVIQSSLGSALTNEFLQVKKREWIQYHSRISRWEEEEYLTRF